MIWGFGSVSGSRFPRVWGKGTKLSESWVLGNHPVPQSWVWLGLVGLPLGRYILGYLERGIQTPMAQSRSTKIVWMIKWIQTSRLPTKNSLWV